MYYIELSWKEFNVNLEKVKIYFKANLSSNFNGLICDSICVKVDFITTPSTEDSDKVSAYWASLTSTSFNPTTEEYIKNVVIPNTKTFVSQLEGDFVTQNIALGISAAGKTGAVLSLLSTRVIVDGESGEVSLLDTLYGVCPSLTVTVKIIDYHIAHMDDYSDLAPFISTERFTITKHRIQTFLGVALT